MHDLGNNALFSGLVAKELQRLERTAQYRAYREGQTIFREGDKGDGIFIILEGAVLISALVGDTDRRVLSRFVPGDFFGEMAVLDNEPRSASAVAEVDTKICFILRDDLLGMLERSPKLAVSLVREFSLRMRDFNRRYIQEVLQAERLTLVGRFARSIVHDFKNPLNVIGISAEMSAMETATPESRVAARNRIRKQVDRLSTMINELLEFTRGTQTSVVLAETDFVTYMQQLLEEMRAEVAVRHVTLELRNEVPPVALLLDPNRLTHVFYNLIHNAVDAMMPDGGTVFLSFQLREKEMLIEVEDTGKGIPPEIAGRLFQAFATYGKAQGTGLGLSICKKIVEDHRGKISASSPPGRGAVFSFTLPLKR